MYLLIFGNGSIFYDNLENALSDFNIYTANYGYNCQLYSCKLIKDGEDF